MGDEWTEVTKAKAAKAAATAQAPRAAAGPPTGRYYGICGIQLHVTSKSLRLSPTFNLSYTLTRSNKGEAVQFLR